MPRTKNLSRLTKLTAKTKTTLPALALPTKVPALQAATRATNPVLPALLPTIARKTYAVKKGRFIWSALFLYLRKFYGREYSLL